MNFLKGVYPIKQLKKIMLLMLLLLLLMMIMRRRMVMMMMIFSFSISLLLQRSFQQIVF